MDIKDYGTSVRLLAITNVVPDDLERLTQNTPDGEVLVEYAGRLCWDTQDKTGTVPDRIQKWIEVGHESVIEHASATFHIIASRVLTHELVRHRIASYSQRSQRYVKESEPRYITPPEIRESVATESYFERIIQWCWDTYSKLLQEGIKPEIARYVLPNACETQIIMTMNFRELRHFIKLRTSKRALPEMREVADKVREICKSIAPQVFQDL